MGVTERMIELVIPRHAKNNERLRRNEEVGRCIEEGKRETVQRRRKRSTKLMGPAGRGQGFTPCFAKFYKQGYLIFKAIAYQQETIGRCNVECERLDG